jgi:metal-sulfur cluster biosynthetic enzyme
VKRNLFHNLSLTDMGGLLENENPTVFGRSGNRIASPEDEDDSVHDDIDAREIFDHIRNINDPEHPLTLEQLNVVDESHIKVNDRRNEVVVEFTPTIPHCSMATLIGLCIRVKLLRTLPSRFKVDVLITPGTHVSEAAINKQLADKERVAAAVENTSLLSVLNQCLAVR